jgi:hypothetical protein
MKCIVSGARSQVTWHVARPNGALTNTCILADEVGLGKTIEAGLVIAQSRAEVHRVIVLIVPKSLIGQWQSEILARPSCRITVSKQDIMACVS